MANSSPADAPDLLALCAVLRWFDREVLCALAEDAPAVAALLASAQVLPAVEGPPRYSLQPELRVVVLDRLRVADPRIELTLHTQAFGYFLRRMDALADAADQAAVEEACLYHLGELILPLLMRKAWREIGAHVAAVRAARPRQQRHLQRLTLYEGYLAVRTQQHAHGELILIDLLHQPDLEPMVRIHALNALGQTHFYQTRYDRALDRYQQLYALAQSVADRKYQGVALINMSLVYNNLGRYDRALDLSTESLAIFRELGDGSREADALSAICNNAMRLGRWQVAQGYYDQAIQLYRALDNIAPLANLYWCQGFLHHMLGAEQDSQAAYERALEIARSDEHPDPMVALDTYAQLGFLYQTQERWAAAAKAYGQALSLAAETGNEHWPSLIHYQRGNMLRRQGRLDETWSAYQQAIERIEALRYTTEDEDVKIGLLGTTQQVYEAMVLLCLELDRPAEAFAYVERARSRALLDTLVRRAPELHAAIDQPVASLAEVQRRLPPDALLVEYFTTGVLPRGEDLLARLPPENLRLREHLTLPPSVLIFAVTHDRLEVHRAALDPNTLRPLPGDPGPGRRLLYGRRLPLLYERLIEPVAPLLAGRQLLYLIPHGPLHYVPFNALHTASGQYLLAADGPMIAFAPSATILLRSCLSRPPSRARLALALGYNDLGEAALAHAEAEARSIARLMDGAAWTGDQPKSRQLIARAAEVRWLHFAGHAVYKPRDPLDSELRLGVDDALSARTIIGALSLQAELVTLSACTSGLSQVVPGDELLGLQRAFLYAGAPTIVCTLWEANDVVARLIMLHFYAALREGAPAAAALRDAQVRVRELTGREILALIERWRAEDAADAEALADLALVLAEQPDVAPFADPLCWATFMLIGRPAPSHSGALISAASVGSSASGTASKTTQPESSVSPDQVALPARSTTRLPA